MSSCAIPKRPALCSIHVPLYEFETAAADFASWPRPVQLLHKQEFDAWCARNPTLEAGELLHTIDPVRKVCITQWDYSARAAA